MSRRLDVVNEPGNYHYNRHCSIQRAAVADQQQAYPKEADVTDGVERGLQRSQPAASHHDPLPS